MLCLVYDSWDAALGQLQLQDASHGGLTAPGTALSNHFVAGRPADPLNNFLTHLETAVPASDGHSVSI